MNCVKSIQFCLLNWLGPVVFGEVGAFVVKGDCCLYNKMCGHKDKAYSEYSFSSDR